MTKEIISYGGSPYQIYKSTDMFTPTNPAKFKKGQRVQERSKSKARDFRTKEKKRIEGKTTYLGGRKYTIVEGPYLSKPNKAGRRNWEYKIIEDGKNSPIPKGQNMIMELKE
tara:strand:- start:373 stop:708 length:336 start_codon:yes stop_codon:yes gene_type:complete